MRRCRGRLPVIHALDGVLNKSLGGAFVELPSSERMKTAHPLQSRRDREGTGKRCGQRQRTAGFNEPVCDVYRACL